MQILITHSGVSKTQVLHFNRWQLAGALAALIAVLTLLSGTVYHFIFLKAAREGRRIGGVVRGQPFEGRRGIRFRPASDDRADRGLAGPAAVQQHRVIQGGLRVLLRPLVERLLQQLLRLH